MNNDMKIQLKENSKWEELYAAEDEEKSYELVQFNHENDDDDIPDGQDPWNVGTLLMMKENQRFNGRSIGELVNMEDETLLQIRYENHPHERDTDDLPTEFAPKDYDTHHSKHWNELVKLKEKEIEKDLKISEKVEKQQEKEIVRAKIHAQQVQEQKALEQMQRAQQKKEVQIKQSLLEANKANPYKTVDLGEVYDGFDVTQYTA